MSIPPISIDDMNTTLIQYKGDWLGLNGSTRQWDGSVHTTSQAGATATFQFRGYLLWVWGTIPAGVGTNMVQLSIDGGPGNITSRTANGSSVFNELYFETPLLPETFHTAVLTVLTITSSTTNESTEFQFDRFQFQTSDDPPLFAPPVGVSTLSVASPVTPSTTPSVQPGNISRPSSSKSPVGAIVGGVIGGLVLVIGVLSIFLWWRRKGRSESSVDTAEVTNRYFPTTQPHLSSSLLPTPFPLNNQSHNTLQTNSTEPITNTGTTRSNFQHPQSHHHFIIPVSEKSTHRSEESSSSVLNSRWTSAGSGSPSPRSPESASTLPNTLSSIRSPSEDGGSSEFFMERRDTTTAGTSIHRLTPPLESPPLASSNTDIYERPPPSYWYSENEPRVTT